MPELEVINNKYILIVRQSEPLKIDNENARLWRASLIHKYCNDLGLKSVYLTSTFSHYNKKQRFDKTTKLSGKENGTFVFLRTPGYKHNISLLRFIDHLIFGIKTGFYIIKDRKKIKTIFASHPTIEGAFVSVVLGRIFRIKVIVDVRDLWPDLYYDIIGKSLISKIFLSLALLPYVFMTRMTFSFARYISAPTTPYLNWADKKSFIKTAKTLIKLPFAYPDSQRINTDLRPAFLSGYKGYKVCVFIGTLNENMFDFLSIDTAVKRFNKKIVFVIAGDGSGKKTLEKYFCNDNNVIFPGWISKNEILNLMQYSDFALAPYIPIDNFEMHVPNKIVEYLSEGLPVIYSVKGEMELLLKDCGLRYDATANTESDLCFENVIERVLSDNSLLERLSSNAVKIFKNEFRAEIVYKNFITSFLQSSKIP